VNFTILPSSTEPIYRQIVEQVRRRVASGEASGGEELPSVRALASAHAINPMTVSKAYSLLEAEGLLERRRGVGMVIAAAVPAARASERRALLEPALQTAARQAAQLGLSLDEALSAYRRALLAEGLASCKNASAPRLETR
jgi:GntR family transcriptional regulator